MPGTKMGIYPVSLDAGSQVSSDREGRHITVLESELIHPYIADGFVNKGDPVVVCNAGAPTSYGVMVGVAFLSADSDADEISLDTEGIFNLTVYAQDDDGDSAIVAGEALYIRAGALPGAADGDGTGDAEISKISNTVTQVPFGYAMASMAAGNSGVIAVKVHFDPILIGSVAVKGLDHVQGTTTNPIAWGTTGNHLKSMVFTVGVLTDYIDGIRLQSLTTDDITAGGIYNIYSRQDIKHDIQNMIGVQGFSYLYPGKDCDVNQALAVAGSVYLANTGFDAAIADKIACFQATVDQTATSTISGTGIICGVAVHMDGVLRDNSGSARGVDIHMGGGATSYPDYGIYITMETANNISGIMIEQLAVSGGFGITFEDSGGFYFDAMMLYDGVNANGYFLQLTAAAGTEDTAIPFDTATCDQTADMRLRVRCAGDTADRYIYLFPV